MSTLIIPMAGSSSRFPNTRPKWMLTHPKTKTYMVLESLSGLNLDFFDQIVFVALQEHQDVYNFADCFYSELKKLNLFEKSKLTFLDKKTSSQSETVYQAIVKNNIEGFIFIKDCDSYYSVNLQEKVNQVCYFDLHKIDSVNAISKSYIDFDSNKNIINIVEKKIISSYFNVGGYGFENSSDFVRYYENKADQSSEFYVSHLIFSMMLDNNLFQAIESHNFIDWGVLKDWKSYTDSFKTLFLDLDGVLVTNSSHLVPPFIGTGQPLLENIQTIQDLYNSGKVHIVITTSRPEEYKNETILELNKYNIPYDQIVMGLPHCQRITVNDFSNSNSYPTCSSINIPRNSNNLKDYIK
jgi:hypothetical protein